MLISLVYFHERPCRIQELEGIRDEIMSDVFKQNSSADLDVSSFLFNGVYFL